MEPVNEKMLKRIATQVFFLLSCLRGRDMIMKRLRRDKDTNR